MKKNPNVESLYAVDVVFEVLLLVTVDVLVLADDRPEEVVGGRAVLLGLAVVQFVTFDSSILFPLASLG